MAVQLDRHRFNIAQYYRMADVGILSPDERVELIEGVIMRMHPSAERLFTVTEYERMVEAGILTEDDRLELIEGEIVEMAPIGTRHFVCVNRFDKLFNRRLSEEIIVSIQNPIRLPQYSEPQPDVALLRPRSDSYAKGLPGPADIFLLVEVADTTVDSDRQVKIPLYARAGVSEVWLVNLPEEGIEVYTQPAGGTYQEIRVIRRGEILAPIAFPDIVLAVEEILG